MASPAPPTIVPATTKQTAVVIFLHHLDSSGLSWAKTFESTRLPYVKYVFPNAPKRPFSLYDGSTHVAWYDLLGYGTNCPIAEEKSLAEATKNFHRLLDEEIALGTPSRRIVAAGYSIGGAVAVYGALTYDKPLAACAIVNSWIADISPAAVQNYNEANKTTPLLHLHASNDAMLPLKCAHATRDTMKNPNGNYNLKIFKSTAHWPTPEMFVEMDRFIAANLPAITEAADD